MGIILLFVAILPRRGVAGRQLYRAEVLGPDKDALTPRIKQIARVLWLVYILLTLAEIARLIAAGMPLCDLLRNTFATIATSGFSPGTEHCRLTQLDHKKAGGANSSGASAAGA